MLVIFAIIPASLVHELTQDFDWWLCTILFNLRHIQIINKDDSSFWVRRSENTLSSLFKLRINDVLHLVAVSLG
jgi:hypothetical protein